MTSYAVSRGHPAPLVGKRFLAGLDSCLVYINFAHTQDHDYVLYLCGRLVLVCYHPNKWKTKKTLAECVQL